MKLLGAAMIAASCGWLCAGKIRRERLALRLLGELVEYGGTEQMFSQPRDKRTEDYITGRFG